jgi:hypothetical protein
MVQWLPERGLSQEWLCQKESDEGLENIISLQMGLRLSGPVCAPCDFLTRSTPKVTHLSSEGR